MLRPGLQHLNQYADAHLFRLVDAASAVHDRGAAPLAQPAPSELRDRQRRLSMNMVETSLDPEQNASRAELGQLLEDAVLASRTVPHRVMLRDVEELGTSETLRLRPFEENVKVRLHRGRAMLRGWLFWPAWGQQEKMLSVHGRPLRLCCPRRFLRLAELTTDHPDSVTSIRTTHILVIGYPEVGRNGVRCRRVAERCRSPDAVVHNNLSASEDLSQHPEHVSGQLRIADHQKCVWCE